MPKFGGVLKNRAEDFVFGYGSLINSVSRFQTDPGSKDAISARLAAEFGYRRCWNFHGPTSVQTALGVKKAEGEIPARSINGVVYPADGADMSLLDEREEGYTRVAVPWD
ncbi:MAG: gamma-glutamylcyclotransferase family protein, partial [bacterium]